MKDKIKKLMDKSGVKKLAIIGAILVIAIVGTVVGVSALKPANEVVKEDTNKDKDSDNDKEKVDEKSEDKEMTEDVAQETVEEEKTTEEQTDDTTSTTGNTNSNSSTNSAITTTTPSNSTSNNNTNSNSSTNQNTQTQTPTTPTSNTWFDRMGFQITPVSSTFCASNVAGHECGSNLKIGERESGDEGMKVVELLYNSFCGCFDDYRWCMFDRYTGTCLWLWYDEGYAKFDCNGKEVQFVGTGGAGMGWTEVVTICSKDYDGVVFVLYPITRDKNANLTELCSIEDVIDFSGNDCCFFSYANK